MPDWLEKIILLGIAPDLLDELQADTDTLQNLYRLLNVLMTASFGKSAPRFKINSVRQIHALIGDISHFVINEHAFHIDIQGSGIFHYAALSGNTRALDKALQAAPLLLERTNQNEWNIAHCAALSGSIEAVKWVHKKAPDLFKNKDANGFSVLHYIAWSGNADLFDWVKKNYPAWIEREKQIKKIACFTAWSGSIEAMKWVKENILDFPFEAFYTCPYLFHYATQSGNPDLMAWLYEHDKKFLGYTNSEGQNVAYFAATRPDNIAVLEWIRKTDPYLILERDKKHSHIAHLAARNGDKKLLAWIKRYAQQLLTQKDIYGSDIRYFALLSGNIEVFNYTLWLTGSLDKYKLPCAPGSSGPGSSDKDILLFLEKMLDYNYTLTEILYAAPMQVPTEKYSVIQNKLERNETIQNRTKEFKSLLVCRNKADSESKLKALPFEVLMIIFEKMMPQSINSQHSYRVYCKIDDNICVDTTPSVAVRKARHRQALALCTAELDKLYRSSQSCIYWFDPFGIMQCIYPKPIDKIFELNDQIAILEGKQDGIEQIMEEWSKRNLDRTSQNDNLCAPDCYRFFRRNPSLDTNYSEPNLRNSLKLKPD